MKKWSFYFVFMLSLMLLVACGGKETTNQEKENDNQQTQGEQPIKVGILASLTGPLESYGKQTVQGFELGLEYATDGTFKVGDRPIEFIVEDTETKADVAVHKATRLLEDHEVDFIVGSSSSADTLAVLPLMEEYQKIMVVEPAVADSITGENWNEYIFRTGRNSSQDAVASAVSIAGEGVKIATIAQDSAFGREGIEAFREAATNLGAEMVIEQYADPQATDFSPYIQKILQSDVDYLFVLWAGANTPWNQIVDLKVMEKGINISTVIGDIPSLTTMNELVGLEGVSVYYPELPKNEVNDWFVEKYKEKYNGEIPDLFTPGGFSAAMAIVKALEGTSGETDADKLIYTMEGMIFETPKGTMMFRAEDHQALQTLYSIKLEKRDGVSYPVPVLVRELTLEETAPPIRN